MSKGPRTKRKLREVTDAEVQRVADRDEYVLPVPACTECGSGAVFPEPIDTPALLAERRRRIHELRAAGLITARDRDRLLQRWVVNGGKR